MTPTHYPSLDRCQKLTELGFPHTAMHFEKWCESFTDTESSYDDDEYVCPSVMEMLDAMPESIEYRDGEIVTAWRHIGTIWVSYDYDGLAQVKFDYKDSWNLPNAIADLIIWLVENSHLTFPSNAK